MVRAALIFIVGVMLGANAMYFAMTRSDRCARCEAASATASRGGAPSSIPTARSPASVPFAMPAATPSRQPSTPSPKAPPPVAPTPLPVATAGPRPTLAMPLPNLSPTQLHDTFGEARGGERAHEALDILAPAGTPVLAVGNGHVEKLFASVRGGLTIYQFDPTGRFAYYYAHLQRYAPGLAEGQQLKTGQLIGFVGSTGNADPAAPHLHFAVFELGPERQWWKGTAINPYPLLGGVIAGADPAKEN